MGIQGNFAGGMAEGVGDITKSLQEDRRINAQRQWQSQQFQTENETKQQLHNQNKKDQAMQLYAKDLFALRDKRVNEYKQQLIKNSGIEGLQGVLGQKNATEDMYRQLAIAQGKNLMGGKGGDSDSYLPSAPSEFTLQDFAKTPFGGQYLNIQNQKGQIALELSNLENELAGRIQQLDSMITIDDIIDSREAEILANAYGLQPEDIAKFRSTVIQQQPKNLENLESLLNFEPREIAMETEEIPVLNEIQTQDLRDITKKATDLNKFRQLDSQAMHNNDANVITNRTDNLNKIVEDTNKAFVKILNGSTKKDDLKKLDDLLAIFEGLDDTDIENLKTKNIADGSTAIANKMMHLASNENLRKLADSLIYNDRTQRIVTEPEEEFKQRMENLRTQPISGRVSSSARAGIIQRREEDIKSLIKLRNSTKQEVVDHRERLKKLELFRNRMNLK